MTKEGGPHLPVLTVSLPWVLQADQLPGLHNVSMPVTNYNTGDWILPLTAVVGTGSPQGALVFALPGCSSLTNLASKMPLESQGPGFTPSSWFLLRAAVLAVLTVSRGGLPLRDTCCVSGTGLGASHG